MLNNIFPKSLAGLIPRHFPHCRIFTAMLPLVSVAAYMNWSGGVPPQRQLLHADEVSQAGSYRLAKRRREWLTGRLCAKLALLQYLAADQAASLGNLPIPHKIQIGNSGSGRPHFVSPTQGDQPSIDLSISHGSGFGLAAVSPVRCGIDIQKGRKALIKVRDKFSIADEEALLQNSLPELSELQHLTLIWTAKEAAKKALSHLRMPGFLELILTGAEAHTGGLLFTFLISSRNYGQYPATICVITEHYQGYAVALCADQEKVHARVTRS